MVEGDDIELFLGVVTKVYAFGECSAEQSVGVFVDASFPVSWQQTLINFDGSFFYAGGTDDEVTVESSSTQTVESAAASNPASWTAPEVVVGQIRGDKPRAAEATPAAVVVKGR